MPGWTAGYVLHIEAIGSDSLTTSQSRPDGFNALSQTSANTSGNGVSTLQSFWFIKSDQLGKVSVGKQSDAADNSAILVDGSGSLVPANWVAFDVNSFNIRQRNGGGGLTPLTWGGAYCQGFGGAWGDCDGLPQNVVRYDSPSFGGFSVSASWGEDDIWAITTRYAGEWADFKVAAVASYSESTDEKTNIAPGLTQQYFQAAAYVEHTPTGLFAYGAYGHNDYDSFVPGQSETWYGKGGIRQRWTPLGHTVLYGEYLNARGTGAFDQSELAGLDATHDRTEVWGGGVVQEIDAAAMSIWVKYRHLDYSDDNSNGIAYDSFQYVGMGALINF
jgi:predicted porin